MPSQVFIGERTAEVGCRADTPLQENCGVSELVRQSKWVSKKAPLRSLQKLTLRMHNVLRKYGLRLAAGDRAAWASSGAQSKSATKQEREPNWQEMQSKSS